MYSPTSTQQPAAICALKSPGDAIHILEAVRLGVVPRVTRRLTGHERSMIRPGTVWVWEEEETNMRRWTDGRRWGASRVGGGGFLVYTETSESHSPPPHRPESPYGYPPNQYYAPPPPPPTKRPESLIKQTYSTSMANQDTGKVKKFHVVAYSSKGDAFNPLPLPHQLPLLANIKVAPGIWPEWESRRESDASRKPAQGAATPGGAPGLPSPVTAMPPTESPLSAPGSSGGMDFPPTAYPAQPPAPGGGRSSPRGYDRPGQQQQQQQQQQSPYPPHQGYNPASYFYPPPPDRNAYERGSGGPGPAGGMPNSAERYHPYARGRPAPVYSPAGTAGGYPDPGAHGGMSTPITPGEGYYDGGDRRHHQPHQPYMPYPPPPPHGQQGYPQAQHPYGREFYPELPAQQQQQQVPQHPEVDPSSFAQHQQQPASGTITGQPVSTATLDAASSQNQAPDAAPAEPTAAAVPLPATATATGPEPTPQQTAAISVAQAGPLATTSETTNGADTSDQEKEEEAKE